MDIYDYGIKTIDGQNKLLSDYKGKVLLIVNTASKCGFTPQYQSLEALYRRYKDQGLVVLAFPCNQFGRQEPGNEREIQEFCSSGYNISFPLFAKIEVNGTNTHPLYQYLKNEKPGVLGSKGIKWNFTKFLVDRTGKVVKRYAPVDKPESLVGDIEQLL
ncbi:MULTISPECIES: glutathione peroxidase [Nitrosomonas]|uniref:Glutathione peroxidase n=2 Tax=Nitrosomonas eutropha TaxID=916 RepID=A0ABX5M6T1_9PROT|nr:MULTISPECIES: glutathione peroxidase [Nitrosomonas]ABI59251.1 Glutathione peroxidase [Nitrosomonas eutropha C91]MXS81266.1 glutathione peroxidase [Nitrosomonas sp. GH22]PXV81029.1 glutathione peroxidase [Nitrosomonas eutropha]SCX21824.1 glutathione peroxidase [Nitrosomonas eutropha]SDW99007.1 glutathione peroxidase [Nitrosomonas eutropha]